MRADKKKRLEERGWKVGTAQEFLGLSDAESAYIELKLRLAEGLHEQRMRRQMTQVALAQLLRSSQSRVAKMEAGDHSVSIDLLVKSLLVLGTSSRELAQIVAGVGMTGSH